MNYLSNQEQKLIKAGFINIAGIDEAGRGPLAGPVSVAAVILDPKNEISGLNDSKKLSEKKRDDLYFEIIKKALCFHVELISHKLIDQKNILNAVKFGMTKCAKKLKITPDFILIDALNINMPEIPQKAIIKGDTKIRSIQAASILAKVERDSYMKKMATKYPEYGFEQHKGYGTTYHIKMIQKHGLCQIHRQSFKLKIKNK